MKLFEHDYFILENKLKQKEDKLQNIMKNCKLIYEVVRIIDGYPLFFKEHIERFNNSCELMNVKYSLNEKQVFSCIRKLCEVNKTNNGNLKLIMNSNTLKNAIFFIQHSYPTEEQYKNGVKTILYHGERKNPNAKVVDDEFRNRVTEEIKHAKAYEAILINKGGNITEGSKSNIFMIKDKKIITAPIEGVLPGITRYKIIETIKRLGIDFEERYISEDEIRELQGLFISGTSPKVLPISRVGNMEFDSQNSIVVKVKKSFDNIIKNDILQIKNNYCK